MEQYKTQRLWNNSLIRIDRKPVYFREWLAKGILTVESLTKADETCFLSYTEFLNKYHCKSCPLAFSGIIATLKTMKMRFKENIDNVGTFEVESFTKAFQKTKKPNSLVQRLRPQWGRNRLGKKNHFILREHAQKVTKSLFSNLNFSIDVCPQIPFCLSGRNIFSWQCKVTSLFWGTFFQWLQSCSLIEKGNHLVMTNALGLKPDSSNTKL